MTENGLALVSTCGRGGLTLDTYNLNPQLQTALVAQLVEQWPTAIRRWFESSQVLPYYFWRNNMPEHARVNGFAWNNKPPPFVCHRCQHVKRFIGKERYVPHTGWICMDCINCLNAEQEFSKKGTFQ